MYSNEFHFFELEKRHEQNAIFFNGLGHIYTNYKQRLQNYNDGEGERERENAQEIIINKN